jgi:Rrf2 family protein
MRTTAKVDYAVRAAMELARAEPGTQVKGEHVGTVEHIPLKFLENILSDLRRAGLVASQRGADGGYRLARPAREITVADIIRAVEGPLATVRGIQPQDLPADGEAKVLRELWVSVRANLRAVLEHVTVADLVDGRLPADVASLTEPDDAWTRR